MKALLASALTALVFVTAAWASNVTPAQFSALSKRVTKLEKANRDLTAAVNQATAVIDRQDDIVKCLRSGWDAQGTEAYTIEDWPGFGTKSGNLSLFLAPAPADGIGGTGYLVTNPSPAPGTGC